MKKIILLSSLLLTLCCSAQAGLSFFAFTLGAGGGGGGGTPPTGDIVLLTSGTVTAQPSATIDFSSYIATYSEIWVRVYNVSGTSADVTLKVSADGSTFDAGSTDYAYARGSGDGTQKVTATTPPVIYPLGSATSGFSASGWFAVFAPNSSSFFPKIQWWIGGQDYFNNTQFYGGILSRLNKQITKAIQLAPTSGNITLSYDVYGIK